MRETFAQLRSREPHCDCDEVHEDGCPVVKWELDYWAHYFGQDYGTKGERQARLLAMDPRKDGVKWAA